MRPLVNLASEPFRNRRLLWLVIIFTFALSFGGFFQTIRTLSRLEDEIATLEPQVKELEQQSQEAEKTGPSVSSLTPDQNLALQAANDLIARKAFSWSQLLNDLERHIPPSVRVLRINVDKVTARTRGSWSSESPQVVLLGLEVVGQNYSEVTNMISEFNQSGIFFAEPRRQEPIEGTEEVKFTLGVEYHPPHRGAASRTELSGQLAEGKR